jgi:hypothetical protein
MPTLPAHPNLDHLRHQAKDLLHTAQAGDADAVARIHGVSNRLTLATPQLALAREYGFASWAVPGWDPHALRAPNQERRERCSVRAA